MRAEPVAVARPKSKPQKRRSRVGQAWAWVALLAGVALLAAGLGGGRRPETSTPQAARVGPRQTLLAEAGPTHALRRIETIRLGERVLGRNPLREQVEHGAEPEPGTWRQVNLELRKSNGRQLYVELLRDVHWLEQHQARAGGRLWLDMPEMGARGWAKVTAIQPCPAIAPGPGQVVTGRFQHEPDDGILDVRVEGLAEPIGVTDTHPFWSEDRQAFVEVRHLREGERVRTAALGVVAITSIRHRPREAWVYNLEVQGEHVYQVSDFGVLVHNVNNAANTWGRNTIERLIQKLQKMEAQPVNPTAAAAEHGYQPTNYRSHGQPVYYNPNTRTYITPDVDSHSGGVWKAADSVENLGRKSTRLGTYDADLNRIGD